MFHGKVEFPENPKIFEILGRFFTRKVRENVISNFPGKKPYTKRTGIFHYKTCFLDGARAYFVVQ